MKIGILSDTHGHVDLAIAAAREFILRTVHAVIHCGDIGSDLVLRSSAELYQQLDVPIYAVLGNCDRDGDYHDLTENPEIRVCGRFGTLYLAGRSIAFLHGDQEERLRDAIECGQYDYVLYGHSHARRNERVGTTRLINPGSAGRGMHPSCAVLDLAKDTVSFFNLANGG